MTDSATLASPQGTDQTNLAGHTRATLGILEDRVLLLAGRAGSKPAFELLVHRHFDRAVGFATQLIGNRADAESIVQDALIRAYGSLPHFRGDCAFGTWLLRIVRNQCFTFLARERREREKRSALATETDEWETCTEHRFENAEAMQTLLAGLDESDRTLLMLRFGRDLEFNEIAAVMSLSLSAVKMRFYRLLTRLRAAIEPADVQLVA